MFDDEPHARFTLTGNRPPKISLRLVPRFRKFRHDTLDRVDRFRACLIGIGNRSAFDHVVVGIERQFYNLERMIAFPPPMPDPIAMLALSPQSARPVPISSPGNQPLNNN